MARSRRWATNRPLRGWKGDCMRAAYALPAFVSWRDQLKPAGVNRR